MATIDIGSEATDRAGVQYMGTKTYISVDNPANDTGVLDTFELYAVSGYNLTETFVGTFSYSGLTHTMRDSESLGTVTSGSKQTFTGKNCTVNSGDRFGVFASDGRLEGLTTGGGNLYYYSGNMFDGTPRDTKLAAGDTISVYATGETAGGGPTPAIKVGGVS